MTLILSGCRKVKVNKMVIGQWEVEIDGTKQPNEYFIFKKDYNTYYHQNDGVFVRPDGKEESFGWLNSKEEELSISVEVRVDSSGWISVYQDTTKYVYKYSGSYRRKINPFKFILESGVIPGHWVTLKRKK